MAETPSLEDRREQFITAGLGVFGVDPEEGYRELLHSTPVGVILATLANQTVYVNPALTKMLGYAQKEIVGRAGADFTHPADREVTTDPFRRLLEGEIPVSKVEKRYIRKDRSMLWAQLTTTILRGPDGKPRYLQHVLVDLTERKRAEARLEHAGRHDPLTGLPNRVLLLDRLSQAMERAWRNRTSVALLALDLDRFTLINDSLGQASGDRLLKSVSARLRGAVRSVDTVARLGADEFAVLFADVSGDQDVLTVVGRVASALSPPHRVRYKKLFVTATTGVATGAGDLTAEVLLRNATSTMHRAKERGGGAYQVFDAGVRERMVRRLDTEHALRQAVELGHFQLFFQPEVSLPAGEVVGFEALLRWEHPDRGMIPPLDFIPVAEETGLIHPIGEWVFREGFRQARRWQQAGSGSSTPLSVSINLSLRQFTQPNLTEIIALALEESGADPSAIHVEITESTLMGDLDATLRILAGIKELGLRLGIDDFGTGYSSLAQLKRFPVDFLKVDRSFVAGLGHSRDDSAIVAAIIQLAHTLDLFAVAEGVETQEQLEELKTLDCDRAQGFHLGRPAAAATFAVK